MHGKEALFWHYSGTEQPVGSASHRSNHHLLCLVLLISHSFKTRLHWAVLTRYTGSMLCLWCLYFPSLLSLSWSFLPYLHFLHMHDPPSGPHWGPPPSPVDNYCLLHIAWCDKHSVLTVASHGYHGACLGCFWGGGRESWQETERTKSLKARHEGLITIWSALSQISNNTRWGECTYIWSTWMISNKFHSHTNIATPTVCYCCHAFHVTTEGFPTHMFMRLNHWPFHTQEIHLCWYTVSQW